MCASGRSWAAVDTAVPASMRQSRRAKRRAAQQQVSDTQKSQRLKSLSPVQQDNARSSLDGTVSVPVHIDPSELVLSPTAIPAAKPITPDELFPLSAVARELASEDQQQATPQLAGRTQELIPDSPAPTPAKAPAQLSKKARRKAKSLALSTPFSVAVARSTTAVTSSQADRI